MFHVEHEIITSCPACESPNLTNYLVVKDHFLSQEDFSLKKCAGCSLIMTSPRPANGQLSKYYDSSKYISHNSQKPGLLSSIYRLAREINLRLKYRLVSSLGPSTLLDFGAGEGAFVKYCNDRSLKTSGYEPSSIARKNAADNGSILLADIPNTKYDTISLWHVLEHVPDVGEKIQLFHQMLNLGGHLVIAVPNFNSYDRHRYKENWAAFDVPRHLWHFSEKSLNSLVQKNGFQHVKTLPMRLDSFYISYLSAKYSRSSLIGSFFTGLKSNWLGRRPDYGYSSQIYIYKKS